jgi:hypothetical protein
MARHVQRKRFGHRDLAVEAAEAFNQTGLSVPGATIMATARQINGEYWVYVTAVGYLVTGDEPLLPNYETVRRLSG